jgi:hypothetical protein
MLITVAVEPDVCSVLYRTVTHTVGSNSIQFIDACRSSFASAILRIHMLCDGRTSEPKNLMKCLQTGFRNPKTEGEVPQCLVAPYKNSIKEMPFPRPPFPLLSSCFSAKIFHTNLGLPHMSYMSHISWPPWFDHANNMECRSQWLRGLRRGSAADLLLGLRVRIPRGACECCVFSVRSLYVWLITRPEESYRVWCV